MEYNNHNENKTYKVNIMITYGTKVNNPLHRSGCKSFVLCTYCGKYYTYLGISRHWDRCKYNPNKIK